MLGLMQDWPLLVHKIIDHAALYHGGREVVSRSVEGPIERTTYAQIARRSHKVAHALDRLGIRLGDRVATLAWNTARHLETWYGIAGIGAIYHTLNPRLFPDQIVYIAGHAEDKVLFFDATFAKLVEELAPRLPTVELFVCLTDAAHLPKANIPNLVAYEEFIAGADESFPWREFGERDRLRPVLHLGHHRQSQGRALFAPLQRAARLHRRPGRRDGPARLRHRAARGADVPCQCLGTRLRRTDDRSEDGHARAEARRRFHLRAVDRRARHHDGGGAPPCGWRCCNISRRRGRRFPT